MGRVMMSDIHDAVEGILNNLHPGVFMRIHKNTMDEVSLGEFSALRASARAHGLGIGLDRRTGDYVIRDPKHIREEDRI
jgi:hypothetical protein